MNTEKGYAFAEFVTPEDCTMALALDGILLHGTVLKLRRPKDYPAAVALVPSRVSGWKTLGCKVSRF